jgi:NAD(P)H-flavin reductase
MMLKVYKGGKLTEPLQACNFSDARIKFSIPRGSGLELDATRSGRIVVVAGGTGLFPFSDLIDLLYKTHLIEKGHEDSQSLLSADPLLSQKPFERFHFTFLIAIAEPEDIHPITYSQLVRLSANEKRVKIVMRVSKHADVLQRDCGRIDFTREYFNKRMLNEAEMPGLSRVWICGPPRLNNECASLLKESGYR